VNEAAVDWDMQVFPQEADFDSFGYIPRIGMAEISCKFYF
jgi:hypothetical protein